MEDLARAIENTLSAFHDAVPQTQEQIYLFGSDMRRLVEERINRDVNIPPLRSHADEEVQIMFAGGFMGLSLGDTLKILGERRQARWDKIRETELGRNLTKSRTEFTPLAPSSDDLR
jgi:hypothetical protein